MNNLDQINDDNKSRVELLKNYNDIDQRYKTGVEDLKQNMKQNADLTSELLQMEELVFQKTSSETNDKSVIPQVTPFAFIKETETINPSKVQMEYFKKLLDLTSSITDRITEDYKLNPQNSLDMLISETETLSQTLNALNIIKDTNIQIHEELKSEYVNLSHQFGKTVTDFNCIKEKNIYSLEACKKKFENLEAEYQTKEKELAALKDYLCKLSNDSKLIEQQCELWKERTND